MSNIQGLALDYVAKGWAVLPLRPHDKRPATAHGKDDASNDDAQVRGWFSQSTDRNIGIATGTKSGLIVVDVDPRNGGPDGFAEFEKRYGKLPETARAITGGGGYHLYFRLPPGTVSAPTRSNIDKLGVDLKSDGGYVVAPPSVHPDGPSYRWENSVPVAEAPAWLMDLSIKGPPRSNSIAPSNPSIPEGSRNDTLFRFACRLRAQGIDPSAISQAVAAENLAKCSPPLSPSEVDAVVQSSLRYQAGSLLPDTDLGNARRLVSLIDGNARYAPDMRAWFVWTGRNWHLDDDGAIMRYAKQVADGLLEDAWGINDPDISKKKVAFALRSQGAARLNAMVELAQSEPGVAISFGQFDSHPHLLNVANGTVDLRSGALRPHSRSDLITHLIDVPYEANASAPAFEKFLADIFNGDLELLEYVQRAAGYAASGSTAEQCFFILHGEGANGKSTLLNALAAVFGTYAKNTPVETLVVKSGGATNDLARLAGARFVTASEANADQRIADALLKRITGDEPVTARFLFKEYIEFRPQLKLFLATNVLPQMNANDPAIWRRMRTIPFDRVFSVDEQDRALGTKLEGERPGILAWLVKGAADWYRHGLPTPAAVASATVEYRNENDSIGQFLEEFCDADQQGSVMAGTLYNTYRAYANDNGRSPVSATMFGRTLTNRGYPAQKRNGVKFRDGLKLRNAA